MQKALEYKGHIEDYEKTVLAQLRAQHEELCGQISKIQRQYKNTNKEFVQMCCKGTVVQQLTMIRSYLDMLSHRMEQMSFQIEKGEQEINKQINKLNIISKEKKSMGKLKERYHMEYQDKQKKEVEILIDDFVANTTHIKIL